MSESLGKGRLSGVMGASSRRALSAVTRAASRHDQALIRLLAGAARQEISSESGDGCAGCDSRAGRVFALRGRMIG